LKKILSIFLFVCFAIYHFGYYAFYFSYDQHLESKWEEKIYGENSVKVQETLIEIPLSAPYMANQEQFQPTNTSFKKDGQYFRAIKQRYQNDTLQIVVVPDTDRKMLDNTVKKWISSLVDDEFPDGEDSKTSVKLFIKDYLLPDTFSFKSDFSISIDQKPVLDFLAYSNRYEGIDSPPPQFS